MKTRIITTLICLAAWSFTCFILFPPFVNLARTSAAVATVNGGATEYAAQRMLETSYAIPVFVIGWLGIILIFWGDLLLKELLPGFKQTSDTKK